MTTRRITITVDDDVSDLEAVALVRDGLRWGPGYYIAAGSMRLHIALRRTRTGADSFRVWRQK